MENCFLCYHIIFQSPVVIRRSSNVVISRRSSAYNANITQNDEKHESGVPRRAASVQEIKYIQICDRSSLRKFPSKAKIDR